MDPIFKFPASPGTPLFPVSPERVNRQPLPQSPSLPSNLSDPFLSAHARAPSDVQGKVAQFNNLSKENAQRRRDNEAALQRAVMGREEAEGETRRLKEEHRLLRKEIEEGRGRERRVGERLEALMVCLPSPEALRMADQLPQEELQRTKETNAHSQTLYEKEVRRARKEAFKASSATVKLQEELKTARNRFTLMREEVESQRRKAEGRDEEVFAAQYRNVGLQEEIEQVRQQLKAAEDERDTSKTSLKEEEVARIAAEGRIPLPVSQERDEFASPEKSSRQSHRDSFKENQDPMTSIENEEDAGLREMFDFERKVRQRAEAQIDFMKMECQFRCCSCRIAESQGKDYVHDNSLAQQSSASAPPVEEIQSAVVEPCLADAVAEDDGDSTKQSQLDQATPQPLSRPTTLPRSPPTASTPRFHTDQLPSTPLSSIAAPEQELDTLIQFSPTSGTFYTAAPPVQPSSPADPLPTPDIPQTPTALLRFSPQYPLSIPRAPPADSPPPSSPLHQRYPTTPKPLPVPPVHPHHVTRTTTTTIPLVASPTPFTPNPTMTREEALEQIRQRRGRARSIAAGHSTPRKQMVDLSSLKRDISAPAGRGGNAM